MALHTRRRLLQAATALAAGLAGCGRPSGSASQSSETIEAGGPRPGDDSEEDPPTLLLRADSKRAPLRLADPDREEETPDTVRQERPSPRIRNGIVDSQSQGERITVADGVDSQGVSTFVSETDFDSETLYLETNVVQECFRLDLCWVSWTPNKVRTNYVRRLRPYDEACTDENRVFESRLIRFPVALDADSVNSFASGVGTGQCDSRGGE